jgi:hypothetical protein
MRKLMVVEVLAYCACMVFGLFVMMRAGARGVPLLSLWGALGLIYGFLSITREEVE